MVREVPRYRAHVVELGTLTKASHEEHEGAADYFQEMFQGEENRLEEGFWVEAYHLEKRAWENERHYPASALADDGKKMALGKVRAYVEGFVGTMIPWNMGSCYATLQWVMKGVVVRVVKGRAGGEEWEMTVAVVVEQQTSIDWKELENVEELWSVG